MTGRLSPERERELRAGGKLRPGDRDVFFGELDYLRGELEEQTFRTCEAERRVERLLGAKEERDDG